MHTTAIEAEALLKALPEQLQDAPNVDVAVFPPSVYLDLTKRILGGSKIFWGGQNIASEPKGAFTGEISSIMLLDFDSTMVILGHSERRHVFGESDELIRKKIDLALDGGLIPIICVGETLEQREAGNTETVVLGQLQAALTGLNTDFVNKVVLAYEPVWAIGTGKTATPEQAQDVHRSIRNWIEKHFDKHMADSMRIVYGGSVKPANAKGLLSKPDIDGALVGGASLKINDFSEIIKAAKAS